MPLKEQIPVIDDRRYDDIVAEMRARIAGYTPEWKPEWNDLNDSDPGVILAQTFAWLSEMLLYRMGRVPELNYVKFLELIGVELMPAQSARTEISFQTEDSLDKSSLIVPKGTQVSAASDNGPPIIFETERPLTVVACQLRCVQSYDAAVFRDVSTANANPITAGGFYPFSDKPRDDGSLILGFGFSATYPTPDVFPALNIDLAFWVQDEPSQGRTQQCAPETRSCASAKLEWEAWDGTYWQRIDALNDETSAFTRSGHIVVRVPASNGMKRDYMGDYDGIDPISKQPRDKLFWLRARLTRTQYELPPKLAAVRTNSVPALQAQTVQREVLGGTSGRRKQTFQIENAPIIPGSLVIEIDEGISDKSKRWNTVDDLFGSGPTARDVAVNWTSGEIRFGDGEYGQIPVANANNPYANVIAVEYRFGGGKRGNVAADTIKNLMTPVEGIDNGKVTNLFEASGGREEERLEEARVRAKRMLRARERAVSVDDFELLAQQAGNVKRAKALPLTHPRFPGVSVPGAVTIIIVPDAKTSTPLPSDGLMKTVCEYLDKRRLLTTELFVVAPRYIDVEVKAQVVLRDDVNDPGKAKEAIEKAIQTYLHPLEGGDDGEGWPFGGALRYSKIVQRIFNVDGVDSVPSMLLTVDNEPQPECRDVPIEPIAPNALVNALPPRIDVLTLREFEDMS